MKTILYNPIFINPQAYYVFPRLTRYLQPDNESTAEPANYIGTIEVKVIAYGDTTLKRTYTNTDSIDLSEFKNTWIRISLFTKVGSCVLGEWKIGNMESDLPYIDPEVLASLKAVVIVGNKTNNDSDRAIVKNLVDPSNPFIISNAAYTEGSGYADKGSPYYGAFVTDGIDDLIKSTKSATEMLDGSNEVTVVSMIHQIKTNDDTTRNNWFFTPVSYLENRVVKDKIGKTGIYGYTSTNVTNAQISDITPILGDKNDYTLYSKIEDGDRDYFTVEGFQNQGIWYVSSIAWYWTIIANKVLTTDQINQVIAYFNLDRTLKPDILCNTIKQGITNENHAEFGDKLIDFSGNGRDIQLNNIAWKGDSGIGKYETDFTTWTRGHFTDEVNFTPSKIEVTGILTRNSILINNKPTPIYNVEIHSPNKSIVVYYQYNDDTGVKRIALVDGINELPSANDSLFVTSDRLNSKGITITQIPSHAGALCLDGVNDFGKVTGMPIYKDYTVVADYERLKINIGADSDSPILSKSESVKLGAFIFNTISSNGDKVSYSFGRRNIINTDDTIRKIFYQSKYINDGQDINIESTFVDSDKLWLGTYRDSDYRFIAAAIYSLMSFPYSMSKFLIERQLKKHKLGTLYPDMVEFRPVIKTNVDYTLIQFYINNYTKRIYPGDYIPINTPIEVNFYLKNNVDELISFKVNGNDSTFKRSTVVDNAYNIKTLPITKSPQKIDITIDEYIRFEDIVQPYPAFYEFTDENRNLVTWGSKIKVGSTITRIKAFANSNLLKDLYNISYPKLNGVASAGSKYVVERQMVFTCTATYLLDDNEPNCILSPRLLRIPNSSYKILGHIPDISGHGNHGKINNSAYALNSGANGYLVDFNSWVKTENVTLTDNKITVIKDKITYKWISYVTNGSVVPTFKVNISGIPNGGRLDLFDKNGTIQTLTNGVNDIEGFTSNGVTGFLIYSGLELNWSNLVIQQIGEYEGAYCLDGVDDFVTIPTTVGGKQVLMKVNSRKSDCYLYDQRNNWTQYLGIVSTKDFIAYNYSNQCGKTYIDGILNENITANDLIGITHNITVTNNRDDVKQYSPCIGASFARNSYAQMALYDFMLFDEISTDDKILELNEYVGIEGNTEWRKTE